MGDADPSPKTSLNRGIQVLPDAYQISFCLLPIAFSGELPTPIQSRVEYVKENNFAFKGFCKTVGERENIHWALRKVNWQKQPVGLHPEVLT